MCNACGNLCCGSDMFSKCGCDFCGYDACLDEEIGTDYDDDQEEDYDPRD